MVAPLRLNVNIAAEMRTPRDWIQLENAEFD
jgi:hypothetical protein